MKQFLTILSVIAVLFVLSLPMQAQFVRAGIIEADTNDVGGFGNVIAGMDFDADGKPEIYAINTDWHDVIGKDLIPRIYKYEETSPGVWETVWSTRLPLEFQNTWGALDYGDMDNDGKGEVVWGIVNNFGGGLQPNPERIAVFETVGDGTDNMGTDNGDGTWAPNAQWTISSGVEENIRPFRWQLHDIDSDGHLEIVAACRAGDGIQIYSVDDVPDAGGGTETWTLEYSDHPGVTFYDMAIIGNTVYGLRSNGDVMPVTWNGGFYAMGTTQTGMVGAGSWKSAQTVDVDNDGTKEIIVASWNSGTSEVYLLQQSGDTLTSTSIKDVPDASFRLYGGAAGDVDGNGNLDFIFGTRSATPNALIHRLEYAGSGSIADPNNWALTSIDSLISLTAVQYDITAMADLNGDGNDEVIYSGTPRGNSATDPPQPIVILDYQVLGVGDGNPGNTPRGFVLRQNYPNPFNPTTSIEFTIPSSQRVSLKIYNVRGQVVRTLVDENKSAGTFTVQWDAKDARGIKVASGIYVYSLQAGKFRISKKMTLLK